MLIVFSRYLTNWLSFSR